MKACSGASIFKNPGTLLLGKEGGNKQMQVEKGRGKTYCLSYQKVLEEKLCRCKMKSLLYNKDKTMLPLPGSRVLLHCKKAIMGS